MGLRQLLGLSTPTGSRVAIRTGWTGGNATTGTNAEGHWLKMAVRELSHGMEWMDCPLLALNALTLLWK